jgi:hypothetical protein
VVIVFGNKNYGEYLGYIVTRCPKCRVDRVFSIYQERQKLTLYFVPTVQYSVKQHMTCVNCSEHFEIADELKPQIAERLMTEEQLKKVLGEMAVQTRLPLPYCQSCTHPIGPGMKYCPNCGKPLA